MFTFAGVEHGCGVHVQRTGVARLRQTEASPPRMTGFDIESIPLQQCQPSGPKRSTCLSASLAGVPRNRARPDGPKPIRLSPISSPNSRHALFGAGATAHTTTTLQPVFTLWGWNRGLIGLLAVEAASGESTGASQ